MHRQPQKTLAGLSQSNLISDMKGFLIISEDNSLGPIPVLEVITYFSIKVQSAPGTLVNFQPERTSHE